MEAFGMLADRFGWGPDVIAGMTEDQIAAYLKYVGKYPTSSVRMVEWKGR